MGITDLPAVSKPQRRNDNKRESKVSCIFLYAGFAKLALFVAAVSSLIGTGKLKCFF